MDSAPGTPSASGKGDSPVGTAPTASEVTTRLEGLWPRAAGRAPLPLTPERVGPYRIERVIGHGTFGIVYLAHDVKLRRQVALKLPRSEVLVDRERLSRFESEARAAASLDHPGIVPLYEANLEGPVPYIASAYCPALDLGQWLAKTTQPISPHAAADFVRQLAEAVGCAHQSGIVHRDLKPSNILLFVRDETESGASLDHYQPRLTDFGLAKLATATMGDTRSSMLVGTPLYMAPEQFSCSIPPGPATDIYSLGCILYELLCGRTPVQGESYVQVVDRLRDAPTPRLRRLRPDLPRALEAICAKCLEKNPEARYRSSADLCRDLNSYLAGDALKIESAGLWSRMQYWSAQARRIREAGIFAVGFHLISSTWLIACAIIIFLTGYLPPLEQWWTYQEQLFVITTFDLPFAYVGWQTILAKPWAILLGAAMAGVQVLLLVFFVVGLAEPFHFIYRGAAYHRSANYALILVCCVVQLALYLAALRASRRLPRTREISA